MVALSKRWTKLRYHADQWRLWNCLARFVLNESGRRSGKTELAKRKGSEKCGAPPVDVDDYHVCYMAPTHSQARRVYWDDMRALLRPITTRVNSTDRTIYVCTGARVSIVGMDQPERVEGVPIDFAFIDEFANMKAGVWGRTIRPALDTDGRPGRAWIYGVPRPSRDYKILADMALDPNEPDYAYFRWASRDIIGAKADADARRTMDPRLYAQEYEGLRQSLVGRAYYTYDPDIHLRPVRQFYDPNATLYSCHDFNSQPGTASALQECSTHGSEWDEIRSELDARGYKLGREVTLVLGEVWLPDPCVTPMVCGEFIRTWGDHPGHVELHGDATGGAKGSASVSGSNWDLVMGAYEMAFPGRVRRQWPSRNPPVVRRVNSVNTRLLTADKTVRKFIDPSCKHYADDLQNVGVIPGSVCEIDKDSDLMLTHLTDGAGYQITQRHGVEAMEPILGRNHYQAA